MIDTSLIEKLAIECGSIDALNAMQTLSLQENSNEGIATTAGLTDNDYNRLRTYVQSQLRKQSIDNMRNTRDPLIRSQLKTLVSRGLIACEIPLGHSVMDNLVEEIANDCLGYGPIEPFFFDPEVTEIICSRDKIRVEKQGTMRLIEGAYFKSEEHIRDILDRMLASTGRGINPNVPYVNASLFDGSRLIAQIPPLSPDGTMFSIRRFRQDMVIENLLSRQSINIEVANFLQAGVYSKQNILVSGGTGSGKTTILNCIASFIPPDEGIVTIEDPCELQLQHPFVRKLEARPPNNEGKGAITQAQCVAQSLRMRPDRIVVGECREAETLAMLQAMNTGHPGSMSSIHSDSAYECVDRVYTLVSQHSTISGDAIFNLMKTLDFIVQVVRERGGRRRLDHIVEVNGIIKDEKTGKITMDLNTVIKYDPKQDDFVWVAKDFKREEVLFGDGNWQGWRGSFGG